MAAQSPVFIPTHQQPLPHPQYGPLSGSSALPNVYVHQQQPSPQQQQQQQQQNPQQQQQMQPITLQQLGMNIPPSNSSSSNASNPSNPPNGIISQQGPSPQQTTP